MGSITVWERKGAFRWVGGRVGLMAVHQRWRTSKWCRVVANKKGGGAQQGARHAQRARRGLNQEADTRNTRRSGRDNEGRGALPVAKRASFVPP